MEVGVGAVSKLVAVVAVASKLVVGAGAVTTLEVVVEVESKPVVAEIGVKQPGEEAKEVEARAEEEEAKTEQKAYI